MANKRLVYGDFRPVGKGDKGYTIDKQGKREQVKWTPELENKRWYFSPSTKEMIPLRQFQNRARGMTYTEYVKTYPKKGVEKKTYKPRKPTPEVVKRRRVEEPTRSEKRILKRGRDRSKYIERLLLAKESYAHKVSEYLGYQIDWDNMTDDQKSTFWRKYHDLFDRNQAPSEDEVEEEYDDFFDFDYDEYLDLEYGETP